MYLDEIFDDVFFLVLVLALGIVFVFIGWKNYTDPRSKLPASPLGRYFLNLVIKKNHIRDSDPQKSELIEKFVRLDAIFALIAGLSVISTMVVILVCVLLS